MTIALIGFVVLFLLLFFGFPLALALGFVGYFGFGYLIAFKPAGAMVAQITWDTLSSYSLSVLPLFLLMGNLVNHAGLSRELYAASNAFVGHRRGGLAIATIIACGGFAAVCGSSLATAATMSAIALPSMKRYGYSDSLSAGSVAAGGTLGILIPPSVIMVIYGSITETSIGQLFIAGIVPGVMGILLYILAVIAVVTLRPEAGPRGPRLAWRERFAALGTVWTTLVLFIVVIGGIYLGVFTATEAAGVGATGAFFIALLRRTLTVRSLLKLLLETARTTAMLMAVLVGALIFSNFVNVAGVPSAVVQFINGFGLSPMGVILLLIVFYLVLGAVFDSLAMILLTVPVFFPLVVGLGFDPIWFGILVVVVVEISLITPPIGMNIFVIRTVLHNVKTTEIYKGILPFIAADFIRLALIVLLPWLVLYLPQQMAQ
ncbi:TRAP transporter large permease [Polymorphum gilvum]|uniref:TRAP transporter large permease protein n=1 Tax=Polymorphum gilvum (strain LMG 25793 / CGMCC 1.9160 / SL003B-26A1) TaxID=991905 RepID=F2IXG9_POLGS|nr:TRAP transporter large permease [Polymorphum gilvum]ADZ71592.1 Predicted TRAP C4-dicarboxylate transport system permease (DctM-like) [Polymorphum gilvum SL003B-26A1]